MRAFASENGIQLKAHAGSTAVLLAMNISKERRRGLLGFAIERQKEGQKSKWLQGLLRFPGQDEGNLTPIDSNLAPIQKFRWSDYTVYAGTPYSYRVHATYAGSGRLELEPGPRVNVRTNPTYGGEHQVVFNRAAAASQAYSRRFGNINPDQPPNQDARNWLSRGLHEKILAYIDQAKDSSWAVDMAIYEIELPEVVDHLIDATRCGASVRIIYHAKSNDKQTTENRRCLERVQREAKFGRKTTAIFHQKFIVLSRLGEDGSRDPVSVMTGTANFTLNGVYRQANMVHVIENPEIAKEYLHLFDQLFGGADLRSTKRFINENNPVRESEQKVIFSPRSAFADTEEVCRILRAACKDVVFCTTFKLHPAVTAALMPEEADDVIRYGVQNTRSKVVGYHRGELFPTPAYLRKGLERFLKESTAGQRGNILVHLKSIVTDFTTDNPTTITGSNNFSKPSSARNDENMFILRGNTAVADTYVCEMMRIYDHYRFRYNEMSSSGKGEYEKPLTLAEDDHWTDAYFAPGSKKTLERERFCASTG